MSLVPPSSRASTPTLAAVLGAGNATTGLDILGQAGSTDNAKLALDTGVGAGAAISGLHGGAGALGGEAGIIGGASDNFAFNGGEVHALHATLAAHGRVELITANSVGAAGQALCPDGAGALVYGAIPSAAGVPAGAPNGKPPFAYDTTAVSGGFYFWNGAAWVKIATII